MDQKKLELFKKFRENHPVEFGENDPKDYQDGDYYSGWCGDTTCGECCIDPECSPSNGKATTLTLGEYKEMHMLFPEYFV